MEWLVWLGLEVGAYETGITGFISSIVDLIVEWFCSILEATFGVFIFAISSFFIFFINYSRDLI